ncbi:MAG TPA: ABC transporter substrate-binding protein [Chloroflexota bacterium]|nr:ABC transporter substrate-binding protein [Chloroflexota bacterium]
MSYVTRRQFLVQIAVAAGGTTLVAACGPAAPAANPTVEPAATRPPTQVPAARPTGVSAVATAAPTTAPTAAPAAAAVGKPGGVKIYRVGLSGDATEMDPARSTTQANNPVQEALYNYVGRYTYHPPLGTQVNPELAEGWDVQDGAKTFIFHLRKGVKYHDGSGEVTADDVKWNWERVKDPKTASAGAPDWAGSTLTVLDPYTLKVSFEQPYPAFIGATVGYGYAMIVSPTAFQANADKWSTHPIGSGPFVWDSAQPGSSLTLKRNPDYWGPKPKIDQIQFRMKVDDRTALLAVAKGELDAMYISDPDVAITASKNSDPNVKFIKSAYGQAPFTLWFNTRRPPLDDVRVRQALRYAIDSNAIAKNLFGGLADPIQSFLPPWMFGYSDEVTHFEYNPDKARQLLKDANVAADWQPSMVSQAILTISRRVTEAIASYWTDIGVKVQNESLEQGLITSRSAKNDFDMYGTYISRVDPDQLTARFWRSNGATNRSGYSGADDLIDKIRNEADAATRARLYKDLQEKLSVDSPAAFVVATSEHLLLNKRVTGEEGAGWLERMNFFDADVPAE